MRVEVFDDCHTAADALARAQRAATMRRLSRLEKPPTPLSAPVAPAPEPIRKPRPPGHMVTSRSTVMGQIILAVCKHFDIDETALFSGRRDQKSVIPRHVAMMTARFLTPLSTTQIGNRLGGRDHTTVLSCLAKYDAIARAEAASSAPSTIEQWVKMLDVIISAHIAERWRLAIVKKASDRQARSAIEAKIAGAQ